MSSDAIGPGSLKCVSIYSAQRRLGGRIQVALEAKAGAQEVRHLHGDAFLVYTEADSATVRDWLTPQLQGDESLFVVEFEHWSGYGPAPNRDWLLRRGH